MPDDLEFDLHLRVAVRQGRRIVELQTELDQAASEHLIELGTNQLRRAVHVLEKHLAGRHEGWPYMVLSQLCQRYRAWTHAREDSVTDVANIFAEAYEDGLQAARIALGLPPRARQSRRFFSSIESKARLQMLAGWPALLHRYQAYEPLVVDPDGLDEITTTKWDRHQTH